MAQLLKVHGSENQFFILDQTQLEDQLTDAELSKLGIKLCNPKNGILGGADGVLVVNNSTDSQAIAQMRVINADGSEAKMCGNGLRTVSRFLSEKFNKTEFKIQTIGADLEVKKSADLAEGVPAFSVQIKPISFAAEDLPFSYNGENEMINQEIPEFIKGQTFTSIAVPNPHLISFVDTINHKELGHLGRMLNDENEYFPEGVNVSFAEIHGNNKLFVETFERGVGFTNACGTGMSATSLAFALLHKDQFTEAKDISVYNPGGMVKTHITLGETKEDSDIHLIGNGTFTHTLDINDLDLHYFNFDAFTITPTGEEAKYQAFAKQLVD